MEEKLEIIPTVKPEVHFELNDLSQKLLQEEQLLETEVGSLEMIYSELQDLEKELVTFLDNFRSAGTISKEEFLLSINYFLVAHQQGPDSAELKAAFQDGTKDEYLFNETAGSVSIPEHTKALLQRVHSKITVN